MAQMNKPMKKKIGFSDIFLLALFAFIIGGVILFALRGNEKIVELEHEEFFELLEAGQIKELSLRGVSGDGNQNALEAYGTFNDTYTLAEGFVVTLMQDDYQEILENSKKCPIHYQKNRSNIVVQLAFAFEHFGSGHYLRGYHLPDDQKQRRQSEQSL
ncbi:MAG: hypothetical protein ACOX5P_04700 [Bacilli bacterium]